MTKILYVEDEPFLAKIVKETLENQNYDVTLVEDGQKAIEIFQPEKFDICILDIMLPKLNGYEVAQAIREKQATIPIIFLTAKVQTEDLIKGFDVGGNDYIKKPFSMDELMVRIENLLTITKGRLEKTNTANNIEIGVHFTFQPSKYQISYKGETKNLSHRESQILELLCKHGEKATLRKQILMEVWGDDSFYNSRNLDVYITKLRNYFKADPSIKIVTLKGVGYQFQINS